MFLETLQAVSHHAAVKADEATLHSLTEVANMFLNKIDPRYSARLCTFQPLNGQHIICHERVHDGETFCDKHGRTMYRRGYRKQHEQSQQRQNRLQQTKNRQKQARSETTTQHRHGVIRGDMPINYQEPLPQQCMPVDENNNIVKKLEAVQACELQEYTSDSDDEMVDVNNTQRN